MRSTKNFLPLHTRKTLYYSFFQSHMSHGILLWGPSAYKWYLDKIQIQQNKAVRIIKSPVKNTSHTYTDLCIMNVNELINFENLKLMYKVSKKIVPSPIIDIFESTKLNHSYNTRNKNDPRFDKDRNYSDLQKALSAKVRDYGHNLQTI